MENHSSAGDSPDIISPGGKSRYGRTRRPKISKDFYPIDEVVFDDHIVEPPVKKPSAPQFKSPKPRRMKSPIIGEEILSEFKSEELTKIDDLGMKVANNFRSNLQRGLDDTIKERKFFKSATEIKPDLDSMVDVSDVKKVLKIITTKTPDNSDFYGKKPSTKSCIKTYSNRRKHVQDSDNFIVESFGLPDEPIIPINSPLNQPLRNENIDIDLSFEADVNLQNPWMFDDFQTASLHLSETSSLPEDIYEDNFIMRNGNLIFPDNIFSDSLDYEKGDHFDKFEAAEHAKSIKNSIIVNNNVNVCNESGNLALCDAEIENVSLVKEDKSRTKRRSKLSNKQNLPEEDAKDKIKEHHEKIVESETKIAEINLEKSPQDVKSPKMNSSDLESAKIVKITRSKVKGGGEDLFSALLPEETRTRRRSKKKLSLSTSSEVEIESKVADKEFKTPENEVKIRSKKKLSLSTSVCESSETETPGESSVKTRRSRKKLSLDNSKSETEDVIKFKTPDTSVVKTRRSKQLSLDKSGAEESALAAKRVLRSSAIFENLEKPAEEHVEDLVSLDGKLESSTPKQGNTSNKKLNESDLDSMSFIERLTKLEADKSKSTSVQKGKKKRKSIQSSCSQEKKKKAIKSPAFNESDANSSHNVKNLKSPLSEEKTKIKKVENVKSPDKKCDVESIQSKIKSSGESGKSSSSQNAKKKLKKKASSRKGEKNKIETSDSSFSQEEQKKVPGTKASSSKKNIEVFKSPPLLKKIKKEPGIIPNFNKLKEEMCKSQSPPLNPLFRGNWPDPRNLSFDSAKVVNDKFVESASTLEVASDSEMLVMKRKRGRPRKIIRTARDFKKKLHRKLKKRLKKIKNMKKDCQLIPRNEIIDLKIGDLAWAKIGTHPYWPCMITADPNTGSHKKTVVRRYQPFYHVRFFGDRGRRSWVSAHHVMLYQNKDDLQRTFDSVKPETKSQLAYLTESYIIKPRNSVKWNEGADEIESLKSQTVKQRLAYFEQVLLRNFDRKPNISKIIKQEMIKQSEPPVIEENIATENPPRLEMIQHNEEPEVKSPQIKKRPRSPIPIVNQGKTKQIKVRRSSQGNLVITPIEPLEYRRRPRIKQEIKEEIEDSQDQRRTTRNSLIKQEIKEEIQLKRLETEESHDESAPPPTLKNKKQLLPGEYSNSDTDSKFSDNSSVPASLELQAALFRRNNIFKGVSKERVCQVCEKSGEVLKCKGPCNGLFHYDCATFETASETTKDVISKKNVEQNTQQQNVEIISVSTKKEPPVLDFNKSPTYKSLSLAEKIDYRMKEIMKNFEYQSAYADSTDSSSEECLAEEVICVDATPKSKLGVINNTPKVPKKEVPMIKHVTADNTSYVCVAETSKGREDLIPEPVAKSILADFKCNWCLTNHKPNCLVCNEEQSKRGTIFRQKCSLPKCGKYYHAECLKAWPQTQWSFIQSTKDMISDASYDTFVCPRHVCHTCISDDPRAANPRLSSDKVVKCLRCPATYHSSNHCVPAGTQILSSSQIICPRHYLSYKVKKRQSWHLTINANWCFICSAGGNLICCETCPTSVHVECLPGGLVESETFYCEDCQSGRLPLYDEIVWVKLGHFRWWPALIMFPNEVPDNVKNAPHAKGEFVVKFFGTYDFYWVGRGRSFLFQEGDKGHKGSSKNRVNSAFVKAIEEATAAHQLKKKFKVSKVAEKNTGMKPPPYIRIKVNKPVGNVRQFDGNISNTTPCDCDPNQPHPCGPDSDCLNRLLWTECNPEVCPAGDRCKNQCFEKREYPPLIPHRTEGRGWGLKTLAPIRKGQFVIEYVGEMIDEQEYQRRVQKMHEQKEENYYFLTIDNQRMLDAGPKGNVARFMNHSCQPNCETQKWTVNGDTRVGLFAKCDIPADTELTFNYNLECIGKEKKICKCSAPNCSGYIGVKVKTDDPKRSKKNRKKKSPQPTLPVTINDNPCFVCGKMGDVGACNNKICTKFYHLECVALSSWPEGGKWVCPWHNCNLCSKRTIRCCVRCVNSYCPPHSEGNVRYDKLLGFICSQHDPTKEQEVQVETTTAPKPDENIVTEEGAVTSTTSEEASVETDAKINGVITSTPLDENAVSSASCPTTSKSNNRGKKRKRNSRNVWEKRSKVETTKTANLLNSPVQNEVKLSKTTPVRHLRANRSDPERDLPIRKRTRLRCGDTL